MPNTLSSASLTASEIIKLNGLCDLVAREPFCMEMLTRPSCFLHDFLKKASDAAIRGFKICRQKQRTLQNY
jgi:hypothetical protein